MGLRILKDIDTAKTCLTCQTLLREVLADDGHEVVVMALLLQFLHLLLELFKFKLEWCQFHTAVSSFFNSSTKS